MQAPSAAPFVRGEIDLQEYGRRCREYIRQRTDQFERRQRIKQSRTLRGWMVRRHDRLRRYVRLAAEAFSRWMNAGD